MDELIMVAREPVQSEALSVKAEDSLVFDFKEEEEEEEHYRPHKLEAQFCCHFFVRPLSGSPCRSWGCAATMWGPLLTPASLLVTQGPNGKFSRRFQTVWSTSSGGAGETRGKILCEVTDQLWLSEDEGRLNKTGHNSANIKHINTVHNVLRFNTIYTFRRCMYLRCTFSIRDHKAD